MTDNIIIQRATGPELNWVKENMERMQWEASDYTNTWVALKRKMIIGCARAEFFRDGKLSTIAGVYVDLSERGNGAGLKITQAIMESYPSVRTWYLAGHPWIKRYYEEIDFVAIDEIVPELKRDIVNQVFMKKVV